MTGKGRKRLSTTQRQALYDAEVAKAKELHRGEFPLCNICTFSIVPPARWHQSHNPYLPRALGGLVDGIAHERCNLDHAHRHDIPLIAKSRRIKEKFLDLRRSRSPMPFGRDDPLKSKIGGGYEWRDSGQPFRGFGKR